MYLIINKTTNNRIAHEGNWPYDYLEEMLNRGDNLIVVSLHSNTIKVPRVDHEDNMWYWDSYSFDINKSL